MTERTTAGQFLRFVIVGVLSNAILYAGYLALTALGVGPKVSMSVLYVLGTLQGFLANKHWSFRSRRGHGPELLRYLISYALGYALNLAALVLLVDRWGYPHRVVQAAAIVVLAAFLFLLQKFWVFRAPAAEPFEGIA